MSPDTLHTPPPRRLRLAGIIAAIVVLAIVVAGVATRANESRNLRDWTNEQAVPSVSLVTPEGGQGGGDLNLPGRQSAPARAVCAPTVRLSAANAVHAETAPR